MRNIHHDVVRQLGLHWSPQKIEDWNNQLPVERLEELKNPYPPPGKFVCEDDNIRQLWHRRIMEAKQADKRLKRCEPLVIDSKELVRTVGVSENLVVRDSLTGEIVLMVVRQFCRDIDIIAWMEDIVVEAVDICRNIRKEDPGHLTIAGFSAGSRSNPQFHWAKNVIRKLAPEDVLAFRQRQSCAFALFWNMLLKRLPPEILDEWRGWIAREAMPGMNPLFSAGENSGNRGVCEFPVYNGTCKLSSVEYAPPSGVMAQNYARAIHCEKQPHKWSASYTLNRDGFQDGDGGHFFVSAYGIRVLCAPDTLIVWQPRHYHGTSLQRLDPYNKDPSLLQRGISFVTSPRLPTIWKRYREEVEKIRVECSTNEEKSAKWEQVAEASESALLDPFDDSDEIYFSEGSVDK
ncbi:hypothetical protein AGABI2DRAFT_61502 [Agaricus bisporus var. bisporus H97]|uniref:hypothetical protein n=1 Tax=Agaricus bisporus var. bisporus (strain H97 / ATCC MYA-4626 / FGSC 10389) TaxID=936046 RepID=UPI00029F6D55|nr:hypothetical protein AGABI2DRAFT_61502 [Agaricus bisporus var. bisporus H97]EKV51228.1 hypothetical protein AGABI2DRAFT_61502 [Agaricus bisporus var. bisporus H97]